MDKNVKKYISIIICIIVAILIMDYFNIPTLLNIKTSNFNVNSLTVIINSIIVVSLYLLTYMLIEKRGIQKSSNKVMVYKKLLLNTYKGCIEDINFYTQEKALKMLVKKIDFNAYLGDDVILNNIKKLAFRNKDIIINFVIDGEVEVDRFDKFLEIESSYGTYINMLITFFDQPQITNPLKHALMKKLENEIKILEK